MRSGSYELQAGASTAAGLYIRGELGARLSQHLAAALMAQATSRAGHMVGVGIKGTF